MIATPAKSPRRRRPLRSSRYRCALSPFTTQTPARSLAGYRVKHRLPAGTMRVSRPALAGKLPRLTVTVPLTRRRRENHLAAAWLKRSAGEGAIVAAAGMLFVFRGKFAARQVLILTTGR